MIGSPYPINNGASTRTLWRRVAYGGRKGRRAAHRLRELEKRVAPFVEAELAKTHAHIVSMLAPVSKFARIFTAKAGG